MTEIDIDALRRHIGTTETSEDVATAWPVKALTVTLDRQEPEPAPGTPLPPGWHQLYFLDTTRPGELGPDGSPRGSGVIPPMPLPRRMFAGTNWRFHEPVRVGDTLRRETELTDLTLKKGSTGTLVFTTVTTRISGPDGLCVEEERSTVYREEVKQGQASAAPRRDPPPADTPWKRELSIDETVLFRFSALTFNTHRIHYDWQWATEVEGYPALVVHGPLSSTLLINFARDMNPGRRMTGYRMRARAPLFANTPITLIGRPANNGNSAELWSVTPEGTIAMSAEADFA